MASKKKVKKRVKKVAKRRVKKADILPLAKDNHLLVAVVEGPAPPRETFIEWLRSWWEDHR